MTSGLFCLDEDAALRLIRHVQTESDLVIWLGDWLSHLNFFSDAQIYEILKFACPEVERYEEDLKTGKDRDILTLAVCDGRWVSLSGVPLFLDTKTSEYVSNLGEFAVTHIMCDIAALCRRMKYRQEKLNVQHRKNSDAYTSELDETEQ
jgi:hypothetical protein